MFTPSTLGRLALASLILTSSLRAQEAPASATPTEWDAGAVAGAELDKAQFRWWAPDLKTLRGVIVLIPGRNGDGRGLVDSPFWQGLATDLQMGLMGCHFFSQEHYFTYQGDPTGDVAKTINTAAETLAAQNGHPELKKPPLVFWGHSAGACVNEVYASRFPERVLAVINAKCPRGPGHLATGKEDVPFLIIVGKNDKPDWVKDALANYRAGEAKNAVWTLALNPAQGHENSGSEELIAAFLRSTVPQRLGLSSSSASGFGSSTSSSSRPKRLSASGAWLGDPETYDVATSTSFKGKKKTAIWLPDEPTALAWQAFLRNSP